MPSRDSEFDRLSYSDEKYGANGQGVIESGGEPLRIRNVEITGNGILTLYFNKPIIELDIAQKEK